MRHGFRPRRTPTRKRPSAFSRLVAAFLARKAIEAFDHKDLYSIGRPNAGENIFLAAQAKRNREAAAARAIYSPLVHRPLKGIAAAVRE